MSQKKFINKYDYILSSDCIPVKGSIRSIIYDLGRRRIYYIPNLLFDLLTKKEHIDINLLKKNSYFHFVYSNDIILMVPRAQKNNFHKISNNWSFHSKLIRASVIDPIDILKFRRIISSLHNMNLFELNIYFYSLNKIEAYLDNLSQYFFNDIKIHLQPKSPINRSRINKIVDENQNFKFFFYSDIKIPIKRTNLFIINPRSDSQQFNYQKLICNIFSYTESLNHNLFYNKNIYINSNGEISFSQFFKKSKYNILKKDQLKFLEDTNPELEFWRVSKNKIDVCNVCEHKFICSDSRVPIRRNSKYWYNILECNYNPYIGKWKNEEKYHSLADSGVVSNKNGVKINYSKLKKVITKIWDTN